MACSNMKPLFIILLSLFSVSLFSQKVIDTTFSKNGSSCICKLAVEGKPDIKPFDLNEKKAEYPGGEEEWKKFVKKNINKKLKGKEEVAVSFEIDEVGRLSNYRLLNRAANQKYEEVVYILKLSGHWFPAVQNGYCVKSVMRMNFEL
jgi:hypothetical protein